MNQTLEQLKWKKTTVLNDGFICVVDAMGTDFDIIEAARVSFNGDSRDTNQRLIDKLIKQNPSWAYITDNPLPSFTPEQIENAKKSNDGDDRKLLRMLMRHRHTTPLEMVEVKFLVRVPMDCWRQWIRHRTANVNEYSTRYTEAIDSRQATPSDEWRLQATNNKQGSSGLLSSFPDDWCFSDISVDVTAGEYLSAREFESHKQSQELYEERLKFGVAKEQARKDLPLSTYTEAYWKCDLHNILHFLGLRMDSHAQLEIRQYANAMGELVKQLFPWTWEAFEDYRLEAMSLTRLDKLVIKKVMEMAYVPNLATFTTLATDIIPDGRERGECYAKLQSLNIVT